MKTSEVMGWMNAASFAGRVGESRIGESHIAQKTPSAGGQTGLA